MVLLVSLCLAVFVVAYAADSVASTIAGLQKRYAAVQTVSAEFRQVYRAPGIDQVESGILLMKKPGLMRWDYRAPERKVFVADGRSTYLYTPEDRQVLVRSLSATEMRSTPLQFMLGQGDILKSFTVAPEMEFRAKSNGSAILRLTPKSSEPDYAFLVLECDRKTYDLRRIIIRELTGNTSEFELSNLTTNVKADDKQFRFKIPKGVEVVQLDEK
jgi:outer membrane lipoprotein carrier protein